MKMSEKQFVFSHCVAILLLEMTKRGYTYTFGDAYAKTGHCKNSRHYVRLAIDINLFKNGRWLKKTEDHAQFGMFWKGLNKTLSWGGDFNNNDGNHYSYGETYHKK